MSKTVVVQRRYTFPVIGNYVSAQFNGTGESPVSYSVSGVSISTVTRGENLPNWMRLIRLGENATTSLSGTIQRVQPLRWGKVEAFWSYESDFNPQQWYKRYGGYSGIFVLDTVLPTAAIPLSSQKAEDLALARFNERVAEVNRQFQGGVFFAELTKTLHGLRNPAEALFKGIERYSHAAKKLRKRTIAKYLRLKNADDFVGPIDLRSLNRKQRRLASAEFRKAAAGLWLEHSFHWVPLMYDIQGAVSALKASWERLPSEFVKVSATDEQSVTGAFATNSYGAGFIAVNVRVRDVASASVRMYGRVRVGTRVQNWPDSKALGYDIRSFVPTIWELIPYSWAVDYFTNIGDIIYGLSYGGQDVMWAARGIKRSIRRTHLGTAQIVPQVAPANHHTTAWRTNAITSELLAEKAVISRATYTGNYVPLFEWSVPGMSLKWLNLGAAFLQRLF